MTPFARIANRRGQVSILGALTAGVLTFGAMMTVTSVLKTFSKGQRAIQSSSDQAGLGVAVRMIVSNSSLCRNAFRDGSRPTPQIARFNPDDPKLPTAKRPLSIHFGDASLATVGGSLDPATIVSQLDLREADRSARQVGLRTTVYASLLCIGFNQNLRNAYAKDGSLLRAAQPDLQLPLYVETDNSTHQIVSCGTDLSRSPNGSSIWGMLAYQTGCAYGGANPISLCSPPACAAGEIDKGTGCEMAANVYGGYSGYQSGACHRNCVAPVTRPTYVYLQSCPFGGDSIWNPGGTSCAPPSCAQGDSDKGAYCEPNFIGNNNSNMGWNGTWAGRCLRVCFAAQ